MPESTDKPSLYVINLRYLEIYLTETETLLTTIQTGKSEYKQMSPRYDIWAVSERFWGKTLPQSSNSDQQTSNPSYENWPLEVMQGDQRFTSSSNQSNNSYNWGYTQKKTSIFDAEQHTRRGYYADIGYSFGSFYNDFDFG